MSQQFLNEWTVIKMCMNDSCTSNKCDIISFSFNQKIYDGDKKKQMEIIEQSTPEI